MGKKKVVTKELAVAVQGGSSSMADEQEAQQMVITPRKRGRPRKIINETEQETSAASASAAETADESKHKETKTGISRYGTCFAPNNKGLPLVYTPIAAPLQN
ncbi:hypothetical protein ACET3Z_023144 [Daucus carota]